MPRAKDGRVPLGVRGGRLWKAVTQADPGLTDLERTLLEEICRLADRLERIDEIITGKRDGWARLRALNDDGTIVAVVLDGVMQEARQQQTAFKGLMAELRSHQQLRAAPKPTPGRQAPPPRPSTPAPTESQTDGQQPPAGVASLAAAAARRAAGARAQG